MAHRRAAASAISRRSYHLEFLESALAEWNSLDGSVRQIFKKLLEKRLVSPRLPGAELHGELADCYKIKLRQQGYRLVYQVRDEALVVLVIAIDRRDKDKVYRAAVERIRKMVFDATAGSRGGGGKRH